MSADDLDPLRELGPGERLPTDIDPDSPLAAALLTLRFVDAILRQDPDTVFVQGASVVCDCGDPACAAEALRVVDLLPQLHSGVAFALKMLTPVQIDQGASVPDVRAVQIGIGLAMSDTGVAPTVTVELACSTGQIMAASIDDPDLIGALAKIPAAYAEALRQARAGGTA